MDMEFVAQRITQLRLRKNVSEYQMSRDLGHGRSYIQNIAAGNSNPSMPEFLYICEYLGVTPSEFFAEENEKPEQIRAIQGLKKLNERDFKIVAELIEMLNRENL